MIPRSSHQAGPLRGTLTGTGPASAAEPAAWDLSLFCRMIRCEGPDALPRDRFIDRPALQGTGKAAARRGAPVGAGTPDRHAAAARRNAAQGAWTPALGERDPWRGGADKPEMSGPKTDAGALVFGWAYPGPTPGRDRRRLLGRSLSFLKYRISGAANPCVMLPFLPSPA